MGNTFGKLFTMTVFGESHGQCIGVIVDGCPAGLPLVVADIQADVEKRRAGPGPAATARRERDRVEILSGIRDGFTTGAPVGLLVRNEDVRDADYDNIQFKPRPGHADYPAYVKYGGLNDWRGGGMFSGRITVAFVMAGAIARKFLGLIDVEIVAHTVEIGGIAARSVELEKIKQRAGKDPLRCADPSAAKKMAELIAAARAAGDSLGGIIEGVAVNVPAGLGGPVFDNLDGELARALFAIPAVKGVEFGAGFAAARLKGSQNNDPFIIKDGKIITSTNNAGGVLGGISTGMPLVVRVAVKPTASIAAEQPTVDMKKMINTTIKVGGRHDACIVPRAVPVVEAMMAVTLCDFALAAGLVPGVKLNENRRAP
ncbi:MAG: chorismate synthase [Chloroflexi bacterium RBG_16_56_11]|nr:MAG: chorismate synthase [Chloroflexi bacterium RBG_16_56_11]